MLGKALDVVTEAPPGQLISGGAEQVRDLFADLKKRLLADLHQCTDGPYSANFR